MKWLPRAVPSRERGAALIIVLAFAVLLTALQTRLPARLADIFELGVAIMLLALGTRALARAVREGGRHRPPLHAGHAADHLHVCHGREIGRAHV